MTVEISEMTRGINHADYGEVLCIAFTINGEIKYIWNSTAMDQMWDDAWGMRLLMNTRLESGHNE